jgi:hypothetical protein
MKRWTKRNINGIAEIIPGECETAAMLGALQRLAAYEDTGLTSERVAELAKAEAEGRLVGLPCKVGATVYAYDGVFNIIAPFKVDMVQLYRRYFNKFFANWIENGELISELNFDINDIGKTVFLTRAEAEAALLRGQYD